MGIELREAAVRGALHMSLSGNAVRPFPPTEQVRFVLKERRRFSLPVEQVQFKILWEEFHSMQAETILLPLFSESLQITIICPRNI